ncbi:hypothetical protein [Bradyrhizobium sp. sBnM-33]|nr:hypothetical protein [Bradyrhizobium sp. sBnM-33]
MIAILITIMIKRNISLAEVLKLSWATNAPASFRDQLVKEQ